LYYIFNFIIILILNAEFLKLSVTVMLILCSYSWSYWYS